MDWSVHVPSLSDHSLKHVDKQIRAVAMRFEVVQLQKGGDAAEGSGIEARSTDYST